MLHTLGIRSAMPINETYRPCPDAVSLRPRMANYHAVSQQIRAVMDAYAPVVEPISIETYTRQRRLDHRRDDARTLFATASALFEAGHWAGRPVHLIGLGMADLGTRDPIQPDLFDDCSERPADSARDRRRP